MDRDELTGRAKWRWRPSEDTTVDLTWLHANLDNGYDGWSIDNTRVSLADRPGKDAQTSDGASLRVRNAAGSLGTSHRHRRRRPTPTANTASTSDWGNAQSWAPFTYDYFYRALRNRTTRSLEVRLASPDAQEPGAVAWLVGVYTLDIEESLDEDQRRRVHRSVRRREFSGSDRRSPAQPYDARNVAAFGQLDGWLSERWGWSFGLRGEQRDGGLSRSRRRATASRARLTLRRARHACGAGRRRCTSTRSEQPASVRDSVARLQGRRLQSRAGGDCCARSFDPEYLWSLDVGAKGEWLDRRLYADVTAFYMKRSDMQVSTGVQLDRSAIRAATSSTPTMLRAAAISGSKAACAGG